MNRDAAPVVIAGCGYTGQRLARRLMDSGRRVLALVRSSANAKTLRRRGLRAASLDFASADADLTHAGLAGGDVVVYLAPPPRSGRRDTTLAGFLRRAPTPTRLVYVSTTGVYGDHGGGDVDEATPVNPGSDRAHRRVDAERQVREYAAHQGIESICLRVPAIYGPGRLQLDSLRSRRPVVAESEDRPGNRVHVDDLVGAIAAAIDALGWPETVNVGDGDHRGNTAFLFEVARQASMDPPPVADFAEIVASASPGRLSFLRESRRVSTALLRRDLGVAVTYRDFETGIAASLREAPAS